MAVVDEAVVLAAGTGSRLGTGKPKFLAEVLNVPLMLYPVKVLRAVGVKRFTVVAPKGWGGEAKEVLKGEGVDACIVENPYVGRENGYSLLLSSECVSGDSFILTMCDHLYTPGLVNAVLGVSGGREVDVVIGGDRAPRYVDVGEATKILAGSRGEVVRVGKDLHRFTHVDVGVFTLKRSVYDVCRYLERSLEVIKLSDVVNEAVAMGYRVIVADATGSPWTEIDTRSDLESVVSGGRRAVLNEVLKAVGR